METCTGSLTKQLERPILLIEPDAITKELNPTDPESTAIAGRQALPLSQQYLQVEHQQSLNTTRLMYFSAELYQRGNLTTI